MALDDQDVSLDASLAGTFSYLSPEQAGMRSQAVDGRSDIFSLGIVFYEMVTGHRPFVGHGPQDILRHIQQLDPRPPRQWNDAIPADVEKVCLTALQKSPAKRFSTAKDFSQALRRCLPGEDRKRRRSMVGWLAAAVFAAVLTGGAIWWNRPSFVVVEPAIAGVDLVHYDRSGSEPRRVGSLTSGSNEPVFFGDSVKLNATFSRPVYPYLFTLDTNGVVTQRFPKSAPTAPLKSLTYPDAPAAVYTLSDGAGTQAILLLAFDTTPGREQIADKISEKWQQTHSEGNWAFTEKSLRLISPGKRSRRGTEDLLVAGVPRVFESVCSTAAEHSGVIDCYGIAFPVIEKE
jgi:serine/threonine protein kinase